MRFGALALGLLCVVWVGTTTYRYFFDRVAPSLSVMGLEKDIYCSGDMQCKINSNKAGDLSVWLDGQPLITHYRVSNANHEHPFTIPTKTIANGKHTLKIELVDSRFSKNATVQERTFFVDNTPLQAAFVKPESEYKVLQGRTLHVQFQVNKEIQNAKVHALAHEFECFPESKNSQIYECFIPINCEETPNEYLMSVEVADKVGNVLSLDNKFQIVMFPFKKHALSVTAEKMKEEKEHGLPSAEFEEKMASLAKQSAQEKLWKGPFVTPIDVDKITCDFGTIRTTHQKGRYMHKALDVTNLPKSVVWASQDGVVALKDRFESTGNTIVIDHGRGVLSMFCHLDNFADIKEGQKLAKGNPLGTIGKTGYATGYHLHWEMRVNNIAIDPMQWTKATF